MRRWTDKKQASTQGLWRDYLREALGGRGRNLRKRTSVWLAIFRGKTRPGLDMKGIVEGERGPSWEKRVKSRPASRTIPQEFLEGEGAS